MKITYLHVNLMNALTKFTTFGVRDLAHAGFPQFVLTDLLECNLVRKVPVNGYATIQLTDLGCVFITKLLEDSASLHANRGETNMDFVSRIATDIFKQVIK